jgi:hypothetical protein
MAKSPLTRGSNKNKPVRNSRNVIPLRLTIPCKETKSRSITEFDISHLLHISTNIGNDKIESRVPYLRKFCKEANQYVKSGKSARTVTVTYDALRAFITFCDAVNIDPFCEAGYLKFVGNDGELRHRIKTYKPSKKLWEMSHGDELGIKESSAAAITTYIRRALSWCGLPADLWSAQHRGFNGEGTPYKGYSDLEEKTLVTRLSELFFTLALQFIAAKKENLAIPGELPLIIDLGSHQELISIQTTLKPQATRQTIDGSSVKASAAFNLAMGAAYHLICFFTSLNDSDAQNIAHPITVHTDTRDKSLQVVKVSSFKVRANKEVDALLTNQSFDVGKRDGVKFIKTLEAFSALYGGDEEGSELLFSLNNKGDKSNDFNLGQINKHLVVKLNLLSPTRISSLPWFKELFYNYRNQHFIKVNQKTDELGRVTVSKVTRPSSKTGAVVGATNTAYCILSCHTDLPLKGILLPLTYSEKDSDGNISVSFKYRNSNRGAFFIPAAERAVIVDIEKFATELADKQSSRSHERLLLKRGHAHKIPKDWDGISLISSNLMAYWSIQPNEYFISLQSSRWREMTSNQLYSDSGIGSVQSTLQNTLQTIDRHYANGDTRLNKTIISQAIKVIEHLSEYTSLEQAKTLVTANLGITMLAHDEWKKKRVVERAKTNPNGIHCNGQQNIAGGKNTQSKTNKAIKLPLPCAEYDMCHKCQSAKAVDEVQSIYKLISFIDVLKEALDQFPNAKEEVHEKIAAFEFTLDGASQNVYEDAMTLFYKNGRHSRVSIDHVILALHR